MNGFTDALTEVFTGRIDHETGEGRATIELVYARGRTHCQATGAQLRPREDVWLEIEIPGSSTEYIGLAAAQFDSAEGQALVDEWQANPGWAVKVWDGRKLWAESSPREL
ncbi:hypothetical protein [Glycomyces sp. YM15]|uniref:hypothetical protein n=1 Tax=Glycomyces sp. YM15 TaxID=2800446 RepID=UPI001966603C|nr:hypothetical protein [Glycomyces sp. YM15]